MTDTPKLSIEQDEEMWPDLTLRAAVLPLPGWDGPNPHLSCPDTACSGDLVAMISGFRADFEGRTGIERVLEGFYVQGPDHLEYASYHKVPRQSTDRAAHLVAKELFLTPAPHEMVCAVPMVDDYDGYQMQTVHFADAVLHISSAWLFGWLDEEVDPGIRPVVFEMPLVTDRQAAEVQRAKARRYLAIVLEMLPRHLQGLTDFDLVLPAPEEFMISPLAG